VIESGSRKKKELKASSRTTDRGFNTGIAEALFLRVLSILIGFIPMPAYTSIH
jgi:hypothetical protein